MEKNYEIEFSISLELEKTINCITIKFASPLLKK